MDWEEIVGAILVISLVIFFFVVIGTTLEEDDEKNEKLECYETYVIDKVILKKCEKYFEEVAE